MTSTWDDIRTAMDTPEVWTYRRSPMGMHEWRRADGVTLACSPDDLEVMRRRVPVATGGADKGQPGWVRYMEKREQQARYERMMAVTDPDPSVKPTSGRMHLLTQDEEEGLARALLHAGCEPVEVVLRVEATRRADGQEWLEGQLGELGWEARR